ncbi:7851_t:CDS:2, partial [Racocetra fulgida]
YRAYVSYQNSEYLGYFDSLSSIHKNIKCTQLVERSAPEYFYDDIKELTVQDYTKMFIINKDNKF